MSAAPTMEIRVECRVDALQAFAALQKHMQNLEELLRQANAKLAAADAELQRLRPAQPTKPAEFPQTPPPPEAQGKPAGFRFSS